ncbi:hypothetical protein [Leptospira kirschneri]|uniref:hypothetical protein n=1 Tax=Leptospira kirschneri TaxID=29507 RepID=UPI000278530A|nr:hypothetical protein [Leptospira kirschneri]EJO71530.1 hypothetical protein LEP1GSC044_1529 [Leptospira kirschneri serovar Grippotyphosa str. RM52]EKQ84068.1 hypothetical protein LEP1GSC064_3797 [Leptospira kirschneri serovar Grippotyphosa str. Moskva]EKR10431.1 hypothetical protein LEP1GSC122_3974 [Leptospira kirschneri serovar Valbuzzi str. 200702274]EMK04614.1 hypothetical protein LEP1GSC176_1673 [Leptospira kirschneri str. MMD1493]KPZ78549.1 hypothetical protein APS47_00730 [Leptospira 
MNVHIYPEFYKKVLIFYTEIELCYKNLQYSILNLFQNIEINLLEISNPLLEFPQKPSVVPSVSF